MFHMVNIVPSKRFEESLGWSAVRSTSISIKLRSSGALVTCVNQRKDSWTWWWLEPWNLIRLSIHWEFHHPNWRTPSFFKGVGIPSITRDDYRWLHVLIVCYEHMRIHKGSVDPHRTSSCGFQILGWSNDVSINEAMSTCSLSVVYPLKLSIFLNDIWSIYGQMVVTYSDITTRSTRT